MSIRYYIIFIFLLSYTHSFFLTAPALSQTEGNLSIDYAIDKALQLADQKQKKAQEKAALINNYYNKGKAYYQSQRYSHARQYFENILEIDPSYEPAKLYMESAIIRQTIIEINREINIIKLKMADIIAEYDKRREHVDSLAIKYFLEQAQSRCQLGDYKGAEEFHGLCYKINPFSKDKIEWFVKATYDLVELSQALDEQSRKIEEMLNTMSSSTF